MMAGRYQGAGKRGDVIRHSRIAAVPDRYQAKMAVE
jgi:hypothetical protein